MSSGASVDELQAVSVDCRVGDSSPRSALRKLYTIQQHRGMTKGGKWDCSSASL